MSDLYRLSETILEHFGRRNHPSNGVAPLLMPENREQIQKICEAAFWASLRRDEGRSPKISMALLAPEHSDAPLIFERRIPITPEALTRLSPAVNRPGVHLGVWTFGDGICVWGTTRSLPPASFVLEVSSPGVLVVKQSPAREYGKYSNIAVLDGQMLRVIQSERRDADDRTRLAAAFVGSDYCVECGRTAEMLIELAAAMQAHLHGGTVLITDTEADWKASIANPMPYAISPAFSELAVLAKSVWPTEDDAEGKQRAIDLVEMIAGFTAVDGATVLSREYDLLAFGAKIRRREGFASVSEVLLSEPVEGSQTRAVDPEELGGTRHRSAAQFVHDQRGSLALVSSQDGKFTTFAWSESENAVHARRVELLLL